MPFWYVLLVIILLIGLSHIISKYLRQSLIKDDIYEAKKYFNGTTQLDGSILLQLKQKNIYVFFIEDKATVKAFIEYTGTDLQKLTKCKDNFEIVSESGKIYAVIYTHWGARGQKFKQRILEKIKQIDQCLEKAFA